VEVGLGDWAKVGVVPGFITAAREAERGVTFPLRPGAAGVAGKAGAEALEAERKAWRAVGSGAFIGWARGET